MEKALLIIIYQMKLVYLKYLFLLFNYDEIMRYTQEAREAIISGDDYYNIFNNYTCASSTKEILDKVIPEKLPNGRGAVAALNVRLPANVTHPYAWYLGFFNSEWMKTEKSATC